MTILSAHDLVLPAASLGEENPLAPLRSHQELHEVQNLDNLPAELRENIRYGRLHSTLPCLNQDGYDRELVDTAFASLVLENDHLGQRAGAALPQPRLPAREPCPAQRLVGRRCRVERR